MSHRRRCGPSSAVEVVGNDDLLSVILLFLPLKTLMTFKLVSRRWLSIISTPLFYLLYHRLRKPQRPSFILFNHIKPQYVTFHPTINRFIPFHFKLSCVRVLQSCNGLLLLQRLSTSSRSASPNYFIFNPTTNKYRNLFISKALSGLCLVHDPSKSPHYKVVCFHSSKTYTRFIVYDSESHTWNYVGEFDKGSMTFRDGVYWNGGIYFIRTNKSASRKFILGDENVYTIPDPPIKSSKSKRSHTMVSNGHLHYVVKCFGKRKNVLYVFEMVGVDSGWFEKYRVDLNPMLDAFCDDDALGRRQIKLVGLIREEKEEDSILLFHVPGNILRYWLIDGSFQVLLNFQRKKYYKNGRLSFTVDVHDQFVESIAPV